MKADDSCGPQMSLILNRNSIFSFKLYSLIHKYLLMSELLIDQKFENSKFFSCFSFSLSFF